MTPSDKKILHGYKKYDEERLIESGINDILGIN